MTALSAQALLRSKSGARVRGDVPITSENIAGYAPAAEDAAAAQEAFRAAGFDVGDMVGISFSITAPAIVFESFFRVTLHTAKDGTVTMTGATPPATAGGEGRAGSEQELPLAALPSSLAARLEAVTFMPPADLHGPHGGRGGALTY